MRRKNNHNNRHLLNKLETRFKTVMIGSLSRIEDRLGFLWGHNKDEPLTEQQEKFLDIWEDLRNDILNHGNHHSREGLDDVEEFLQNQDEYTYKFYMNRRNYE